MKLIGIAVLTLGFVWIAFDASVTFTAYSYAHWMWHTKQFSTGDVVPRAQAINGMRDFQIAVKDRHRLVLLPASLMLAGGLIGALGNRKERS